MPVLKIAIKFPLGHINRSFCTAQAKPRISIELDKTIESAIKNEEYKPRHHPGVDRSKCATLPTNFISALEKCLGDFPLKSLWHDGLKLSKYLRCRHIPPDADVMREKKSKIYNEVLKDFNVDFGSLQEEDASIVKKKITTRVERLLGQRTYAWKAINYDEYRSRQYLLGRSAQEYAVLLRIMSEIKQRDPSFKPNSYFDFGSGIGTGLWAAAALWRNSIFEYFMVDSSRHMNDLAELLLRDGDENKHITVKNVYFRQFLPSNSNKFDVVVSAYTLFEMPDIQTRLETLQKLWRRCENYLIIVEQGTNAGFSLVNEAREFLLQLKDDGENTVFAPCPHELECPRIVQSDGTPCNFEAHYEPLPYGVKGTSQKELYSYVVLKKGPRSNDSENWPRIVRPALVRSKHTVCRMCTKNGQLQEVIFTASKHGKETYKCARKSKWGDRLPIEIGRNVSTNKTD